MEIHGEYDPRFQPVVDKLAAQLSHFGDGAAVCVYLEGEPVVDIWGGTATRDGAPWQQDTMAITYSATKGVVSTLLHNLVSDGLVEYDAPVAAYWPAFAQRGKGDLRVSQVLTHQAGLHRVLEYIKDADDVLDWERMIERMASARATPSKRGRYHALAYGWLVGSLIERVTGQRFVDALRDRLTDPLGLDGLYIGAPPEVMSRVAEVAGMPPLRTERICAPPTRKNATMLGRLLGGGLSPGRLRGLFADPRFWQTPIPSINGVMTARSLARVYAALAEGGTLDGARIVTTRILEAIQRVRVKGLDGVAGYPLHWRLGYHRADAMFRAMPAAFGHYGVGGAGGWANPAMRLAMGYVHNGDPASIMAQTRAALITGDVYRSIGEYHGLWRTLTSKQGFIF